jgi:short-chain fatty acids transporter
MSFFKTYTRFFEKFFPSVTSLAIGLTVITFLLGWFIGKGTPVDLMQSWYFGLWNESMLAFAFQMILMLVLGHTLALSPMVDSLINFLIKPLNTNKKAIVFTGFSCVLVGLFNWGLALIFGAILTKKIGDKFSKNNWSLNYPLLGAAGYTGLMVWHGGISGSATSKAAESGHLASLNSKIILPDFIGYNQTVFGPMNITASLLLLFFVPLLLWWLSSRMSDNEMAQLTQLEDKKTLDSQKFWTLTRVFGFIAIMIAVVIAKNSSGKLSFLNANFINYSLLALCVFAFGNMTQFFSSLDEALKGASGILIQFPLYFGVMGILNHTGMTEDFASWIVSISNQTTLPLLTFITSGIVNVFVPSGGGQWAIQGKIIIQSAFELNIPLEKMIMAFCYGDQITNMLQPFWALPLLAITKLKASQILPYTLLLFILGVVLLGTVLLIF